MRQPYNLKEVQVMQIQPPCPNSQDSDDCDAVRKWKGETEGIDLGLNSRVTVHCDQDLSCFVIEGTNRTRQRRNGGKIERLLATSRSGKSHARFSNKNMKPENRTLAGGCDPLPTSLLSVFIQVHTMTFGNVSDRYCQFAIASVTSAFHRRELFSVLE